MTTNTSEVETHGMLEVHVKQASEVDDALTKGIEVVKTAAMEQHTGILVTRTGVGKYLLRAHPDVPFGLIHQQNEPR